MANVAYLPDDVTYDSEREILNVNGTKISLELLRHFRKDFIGLQFEIIEAADGFAIKTLNRIAPSHG